LGGKIKLGIVGFGRVVEVIHLPLLKKFPLIEVCGVFDITPQRLSLAARRGFATYSRLDEMLAADLDAVLIATPHASHADLAGKFLQAGKHVLLEKPVTVTGAEALALQSTAAAHGKLVSVFHNRRYDRDFKLVRQAIDEGVLGNVSFVERRHQMFGSGASFGVKSFRPTWREERAYGGGALLDWGVHLLDQLLNAGLGKCIEVRSAIMGISRRQGDVEDYVYADLLTDRSIRMMMEVNFSSHPVSPFWVVGGDRGTLHVNPDGKAYLHKRGFLPRELLLESASDEGPLRIYASFVDVLTGQGELAVTLEQAIETMRVADCIRNYAQQPEEIDHGYSVHGASL